jgi:hypothetical protein
LLILSAGHAQKLPVTTFAKIPIHECALFIADDSYKGLLTGILRNRKRVKNIWQLLSDYEVDSGIGVDLHVVKSQINGKI